MRAGWLLPGCLLVALLSAGALLLPEFAATEIASARGDDTAGRTPDFAPPTGYDLVPSFQEEFDGDRIDPAKWVFIYGEPGSREDGIAKRSLPYNGERQVYFDKTYLGLGIDPFTVKDGVLTITAAPLDDRAKTVLGADLALLGPQVDSAALPQAEYSSGLISTRGRFVQRYGYFEIRARWSRGKGLWPAFWMLPQGGGWPPEIDIMEAHGDKNSSVFQSAHSRMQTPKGITNIAQVPGSTMDYHRYGVLWLPDRMDFYIDGVKSSSIVSPPDMNKPMYILANLAVGGYWPGYPDGADEFPATMDIDYIRVWKLRNDTR